MKYANNNIQMNLGNSGALLIRNTTKMVGGLALAGMVAMDATFGSVSADSPLTSSSYLVHGPNAMDIEYLNKLSNSFMIHGPNAMDVEYLNNLGSDNVFRMYEPDVVETSTASAFRIHGPDAVETSTASAFRIHGPDAVETSTASAFRIHGPDAVETSTGATIYVPHGPNTSEWNG